MLSRNKKNEYIFRQIYAMLKRYKFTVNLSILWKYLLFQIINCNESRNKSPVKYDGIDMYKS